MSIAILDSATPITEQDIALVEQRLGKSIPPVYRTFLLAHNGGRPQPDGFSSYGEKGGLHDQSRVDWLFGINTGAYYNDLEQHFDMVRERRVPANLLPIANDPGGNLICLSTAGAEVGTVYFWDHEFEVGNDGDPPTYDNVFFIAGSFDEFLAGLRDLDADQ